MPKTLLLADDSVTIRKVVSITFANEDLNLVTVDNGDDAIARAREIAPDLVLADVVMPGKNGYEVCEALKSDPALRHVPVLLLTGTFEAFDEDRAARVGADGHVTKPFEAQALVERVKELLARPTAPPPPVPVRSEDLDEREPSFDFLDGARARAAARDGEPPAPPESAFGTEALTQFTRELGAPARGSEEPDLLDAELEAGSSDDWLDEEAPAANRVGSDALGELENFDFEFDGGRTTVVARPEASGERSWPAAVQVGEEDIARETVVNPAAAGAFDVSFRDLRGVAEPVEAPVGATTRRLEPDPTAFDGDALAFDAPAAAAIAPKAAEEDLRLDAASETRLEDAPMGNDAWDADLEPVAHTAPTTPGASVGPAATPAPAQLGTLAPLLRQQIHESLEKIAWEAFGDLAERIVPQVIEKVEAVAWEVIPQMTEALIQEEIRRLKGER